MNIGIYQCFIIHICVLFYDTNTLFVEIKENITGILGKNETEIVCSYIKEQGSEIKTVNFFAFNKTLTKFESILYLSETSSFLTPHGQYLNGRVSFVNITQSSAKSVMKITNLMCLDNTLYQCTVRTFKKNVGEDTKTSNNTSISVQVPPSKPDRISLVHTPADVTEASTKHMTYTTSSPSTAVKSTETETVSQFTIQNDTNAYDTVLNTDNNTKSSILSDDGFSSDSGYRTTTSSLQQTTTAQGIAEGDTITVVCTGDVGKPPAEHIFQKYRNDNILSKNYTATETSISEMSENCSYYRTSNLTFQVSADDNNVVIRCVVNSSIAEPDMYVETEPLEVYYEVNEPTITKYPNDSYYVVEENTSIRLTCKSDGNPNPNYKWYKDNMLISTNESLTITDINVTKSGIYTCNVSNTFNGFTHRNAKQVQIDIMNKADISTTKSSSIGSSSGVDKEEEKPEGNLGLVIGIVVAVVTVIVVIIVIIACRRRKSKSPTSKNVSNSFDDSKPKPVTETRTGDYDYIALEDDAPKRKSSNNGLEVEDIIKHNEEYLKKQEEEEKKKNGSNTPPQPAVYAQVNEATKLKNKPNTDGTENTDTKEEDPYAESQENVYDKAGNSRHKENENVEHFDSLSESKQNSNGDNKQSIQTSQVGSYANQGFEKDENRKVATVSPTVRSSSGSQNNEQTNSNRNSQSKKGYENIIGTDQTGISTEESSHRTAL